MMMKPTECRSGSLKYNNNIYTVGYREGLGGISQVHSACQAMVRLKSFSIPLWSVLYID